MRPEEVFLLVGWGGIGVAAAVVALWAHAIHPLLERRAVARKSRENARHGREQKRIESGLPAHERCLCDDCAAWRAIAGNITRLQS